MPDKICSLINNTFDNGTVNIKNLEQLIRLIVQKFEDNVECLREKDFIDPISILFSSKEVTEKNRCTKHEKKSMPEIINLLNITKRVEALEVSVQKLISIVHSFVKEKHESDSICKSGEKYDQNQLIQSNIAQERINSNKEEKIFLDNEYLESREEILSTHKIDTEEFLVPNEQHETNLPKNESLFRNQIYRNEKQMKINDEKMKDLFFACEQNEEKIDETILSFEILKSKIYCLESRFESFEKLLHDVDDRFGEISNKYQNFESTKANLTVTDDLANKLNEVIIKLTKIEVLEEKFNGLTLLQKSSTKFEEKIKNVLSLYKIQIDDKMDRKVHEQFKTCFFNNFDKFINDLRIILSKINNTSLASGTSISLESNMNCISCKNNAIITTELNSKFGSHHPQHSKRSFRKVPNLRPSIQKSMTETDSCCFKNSLDKFPLPQEFFIVTSDNSIFKADPIECLKNQKNNYKII